MPQMQGQVVPWESTRPELQKADLVEFFENRKTEALLHESTFERIVDGGKEPSEESRRAVDALVKGLGLKGDAGSYDLCRHRSFEINGAPATNATSSKYSLVDKTTGESTQISYFRPRSAKDGERQPAEVNVGPDTDLVYGGSELATLRVARQLGLDPKTINVELSYDGKPLGDLTPVRPENSKILDVLVSYLDGTGETKTHQFIRATGRPVRDSKPAPEESSAPVYMKKDPADSEEHVVIDLPKSMPPHLRRTFEFAEKVHLKVVAKPEEPGNLYFLSREGGFPFYSRIELPPGSLENGKWQSIVAGRANRIIAEKVTLHYIKSGMFEFIETGKIPETATEEFKADFHTDLNQMFGLAKNAPTELRMLNPQAGPLAGSAILAVTNKEGIPAGSIHFKRQENGKLSIQGTAFSESIATELEPEK